MLDEGVAAALGYLGLRYRTVGYVERDAYAAACLLARMEEQALEPAPVWAGNLEDVRWERWSGAVDCIVSGFPCQPWSAAGKQRGISDERWIWPAIVECIRAVGPSLVFFENVRGLVSGGGLEAVLGDLASSANPHGVRRRLNPAFVCWLMGWPWWWTRAAPISCAAQEMAWWRFRLLQCLSSLCGEF